MHYLDKSCIYSIDYLSVIEQCLWATNSYSGALRDLIFENTQLLKIVKGTYLIKPGQLLQGNYSIVSGCVKEYYFHNNEQKITQFFTENDLMPLVTINEPLQVGYYWQCVEDSLVSFQSFGSRQLVLDKYPFLRGMSGDYAQQCFLQYQQQIHLYQISSPEQRYVNLLQTSPQLVSRLPQYEIANYIGIKAESLSRIRRRMYQFEKAGIKILA